MSQSRGSKLKLSGRATSAQAPSSADLQRGGGQQAAAPFVSVDMAVLLALEAAPIGGSVETIVIDDGQDGQEAFRVLAANPPEQPVQHTNCQGTDNHGTAEQAAAAGLQEQTIIQDAVPAAAPAAAAPSCGDPPVDKHADMEPRGAKQASGKGGYRKRKASSRAASYHEDSDGDAGQDDNVSSASLGTEDDDDDDDDDFDVDSDEELPKKKKAPAKAKQAKQGAKSRCKPANPEASRSGQAEQRGKAAGGKKAAAPKQTSGKAASGSSKAATAAAAGSGRGAAAAPAPGRANQRSGGSVRTGKLSNSLEAADSFVEGQGAASAALSSKLSPEGEAPQQPAAGPLQQQPSAGTKRPLEVLPPRSSIETEAKHSSKGPLKPLNGFTDRSTAPSTGAGSHRAADQPKAAAAVHPGPAVQAAKPATAAHGVDNSSSRAAGSGAITGLLMGSFRVAGLRRPQRR